MIGTHSSKRARQAQATPGPVFWLVLSGGLLVMLIAAAGLIWSERAAAKAGIRFDPADVDNSRPMSAMHRMDAGAPIAFLDPTGPQPQTSVPATFYDFGRIGPTDVVERTFVIRNDGEAPLTISNAYTTCACTTAEISSGVIAPGKLATVTAVFDAGYHDAAGQTVRRGVIIENNDPRRPQIELWIQAEVAEQ